MDKFGISLGNKRTSTSVTTMHAGDDELVSMGRGLADAALQQLVPGVAVHAGRNSVNLLQLERGHANVAEGQPVGEETIFRIFSLTKVIVIGMWSGCLVFFHCLTVLVTSPFLVV